MNRPTGLILAGGVGRRLGRTKGDLCLEGRSLATRAAEMLDPLCERVLISVRDPSDNPAPGYTTVADPEPAGRGPLAGIAAGFAAGAGDLLVLACDYPRVTRAMLERLLTEARVEDEIVLVDGHPLVALWRPGVRARLDVALERASYRVGALVEIARTRVLGSDCFPGIDLEAAMLNLNRPEDLERLGREPGAGPGKDRLD